MESGVQRLEQYRKILENADEALALIDIKGAYLMQNAPHQDCFGFSDTALIGKTPVLCWGENSYLTVMKALAEKGTFFGEVTGRNVTTHEPRIALSAFPILDPQGKTEGYLLMHRPMAETSELNDTLRLAASVIGHRLKGMMVCDLEGRVQWMNATFTRLTGYDEEALIGGSAECLYSGHQGEDFYAGLWKILRESGQWQGELWIRRKDGGLFPASLEISAVPDSDRAVAHYVGLLSDITAREISEERLLYLGHHDLLTHLPNLRLLNDRLVQSVKQAERKQEKLSVLHIDLDHFKPLNEALGTAVGDRLLIEAGQRLKNCVRDADTVARITHDTFVILLTESSEIEHTATIAQKILHLLSQPMLPDAPSVRVTGSIGISLYPADGCGPEALLRHAEDAMRRVKNEGRNGYRFYSEEMGPQTLERIELKMAMQRALERNEFQVYYQPQVDLKSGRVFCMEALVRWQHPEKGLISPSAFIPMAEETRLILPLGEWVLRTACRQLKRWRQRGLSQLRIAVNLSAAQFRQENLPDLVRNVLRETGIDPGGLELEITESITLENIEKGIETMHQLERLGVRLAVDDFGIGYSSLGYLRQFPIHTLKVDQSIIQDITTNPDDAAITAAIIAMGQNLNLEVIAEGVETQAQMAFLREHLCDRMQGYYFSRPKSAEDLEDYLAAEGLQA